MGEESTTVYTFGEVCKHNSSKDCWLIIDGKVYDVTKFLDDHPGGDDVILCSTGKDATDDFEDVGHSANARKMLKDYYIGEIDSSTITKRVQRATPKQPQHNQETTSLGTTTKTLKFLIPLFILWLALGIRFYNRKSA